MSRRILLVTATTVLAAPVQAQEFDLFGQDLVEGTLIRTAVEAGVTYTDNFFFTPENRSQDDGTGLLLKPSGAITRSLSRVRYGLGINAELARFDLPDSVDDYEDFSFGLGLDWQPASRHQLTFGTSLQLDHDPFGQERTENTSLENRSLDEWRLLRGDVRYRIGIPAERFNYELRFGVFEKDYTTNEDFTQFLNHRNTTGDLSVFYNYSPKTSAFVNVVATAIDYEATFPGTVDRSADEFRYLVGVRWSATAKTSGDFRIGYFDRKPKDSQRDNFNGLDWRAGLTWSPLSYRSFGASIGRSSQESFINTVTFINNQYYNLSWSEDWTTRFRTVVSAGYIDTEFVGSARDDEAITAQLESQYRLSRSLRIIGRVGQNNRDSNFGVFEFERLNAYLGFGYSR